MLDTLRNSRIRTAPHDRAKFTAGRGAGRCCARRQLCWVFLVPLLCGCPPPQVGVRGTAPAAAVRETSEIVQTVQSNAAKVDRPLWSNSVTVMARFKDERGASHVHNLEGSMLFRKPRDLRIDLRPGLGDRFMGIGSNDDDYWVWIEPELGAMRWGRHRYSGKPCAEKIPVRPDELAALLGFGGLPEAKEGLVGPVRQFGSQFDILFYARLGDDGRWLLDRKYYVERVPPFLVRVVNFYDPQGRAIMSALLDDYRMAWAAGPMVPHKVHILWPRDNAAFNLEALKIEGRSQVAPKAFARPTQAELPAGVREIIQVDADCDRAQTASKPAR